MLAWPLPPHAYNENLYSPGRWQQFKNMPTVTIMYREVTIYYGYSLKPIK